MLVDLQGQITCNNGTSPGFTVVLSRRLSLAPSEPGSFSLLGLRSEAADLAQTLTADLTAQTDAAGNFHFANLPPNTTFLLTITALDGTVVVREAVTTPATGTLRFSRSVNCFVPLPPLLPPPPPLLLPPPPPPLIPLPPTPAPMAPAAASAPAGVPIIPEGDSLGLLASGLLGVGLLWRLRRRRE